MLDVEQSVLFISVYIFKFFPLYNWYGSFATRVVDCSETICFQTRYMIKFSSKLHIGNGKLLCERKRRCPRKAITVYPFYNDSIALWALGCKVSVIAEKSAFLTGRRRENKGRFYGRKVLCGEGRS